MSETTASRITSQATETVAPRSRLAARGSRRDRGFVVLLVLYALSLPLVSHRMTASDAIEYYSYARSVYFDGDLNFFNDYQGFIERNPKGLEGFRRGFIVEVQEDGTETPRVTPTGHAINFGPLGSALLWFPFFLVGDGVARTLHALGSPVQPDGFSAPYLWAVSVGSAVLGMIALLLTYRLAKAIAGARAAFWASLLVWLGTGALFYTHLAPTYSHAPSWFACALFLTVWYGTRTARTWRGWLLLGMCGGLMGLVREQDAVFLMVPVVDEAMRLLPGVRRAGAAWLRDVGRTVAGGLLFALAAVLTFAPQLFAYRVIYGAFRPSSDVSQKMNPAAPNGLKVLFDPGHGLFLWTPALLVAIVGLVLLIRRDARLGVALATGLVLTWYLNGAIQTWSTAGSYGARRFVVCAPVFAVGFAVAFQQFSETAERSRSRWRRWAVPAFVALAVYWNVGFIAQFVLDDMDRQRLEWPRVLTNQVTKVPGQVAGNAWRIVTNRDSFYAGGKG